MSFFDRFRPARDPQEPATPPPFKHGDRVVVLPGTVDGVFLTGQHGVVTQVVFTTDPDDPFGPWVVFVFLDGDAQWTRFHADELTRETTPPAVTINVTQPEDEDFTAQGEVPADTIIPVTDATGDVIGRIGIASQPSVVGPDREQLQETPVYDQVREEALAERMFAAKVEADLKTLTERRR